MALMTSRGLAVGCIVGAVCGACFLLFLILAIYLWLPGDWKIIPAKFQQWKRALQMPYAQRADGVNPIELWHNLTPNPVAFALLNDQVSIGKMMFMFSSNFIQKIATPDETINIVGMEPNGYGISLAERMAALKGRVLYGENLNLEAMYKQGLFPFQQQ